MSRNPCRLKYSLKADGDKWQDKFLPGRALQTPTFWVFVPHVTVLVQTHFFSFCTTRDRPGTKTGIIIVTISVKVNSKDDTFSTIGGKFPITISGKIRRFHVGVRWRLFMGDDYLPKKKFCSLWRNKTRGKETTNIWVSVWWKLTDERVLSVTPNSRVRSYEVFVIGYRYPVKVKIYT